MTLTIETLTSQAKAAFDAKPTNKFGAKTATHTATAPLGEAGAEVGIECTMTLQRGGFRRDAKVTTQYKLAGKVISRDALAKLLEPHLGRKFENPALLAAFEARAPEMAEDFIAFMRKLYADVSSRFPAGVPAHPRSGNPDWQSIRFVLRDVCVEVRASGKDTTLQLDEALLRQEADRYGLEQSRRWFHKTGEKLGHLTQVELHDQGGGWITVVGQCRGEEVQLSQTRILKWSPRGKPFHQFPARLYVNGKFTTAAAYAKRFKTAEPC